MSSKHKGYLFLIVTGLLNGMIASMIFGPGNMLQKILFIIPVGFFCIYLEDKLFCQKDG